MKNNETNYGYFESLVSLVLDGEASEVEQKAFKYHVSTSSECKRIFESERNFRELIRESLGNIPVPRSFAHQIRMHVI